MPETSNTRAHVLHLEEQGYRKVLAPRQLRMIAVGGAVGTGLILGSGKRLHDAGPGLFLVYACCGLFVYLVLRALGELVSYRPASGSFVSYAREFFGEKAAYVSGWMYFLNWTMAAVVDTTAIARYCHYWRAFAATPQWVLTLAALLVALAINLTTVRWFGEIQYWTALVKVVALSCFLVFGAAFLGSGGRVAGEPTGFGVIARSGGLFPSAALPVAVAVASTVFAYAAVEMVGTAAGETARPARVVPRAITAVFSQLLIFYVGSLVVLALLLPGTEYEAGTSPFVTLFARMGSGPASTMVNVVILTAALSSLNAGLYSTGRVLHAMAVNGSAPAVAGRMSSRGVPYGGILLTGAAALCGVGLNAWVPSRAFEIGLGVASLGIIASWAMIVACQLELWRRASQGRIARPPYRMFGAPYTGLATLGFLMLVPVVMALDYPDGTCSAALLFVIAPALMVGWYATRGRVMAGAARREGYQGDAISTVSISALDAGGDDVEGTVLAVRIVETPEDAPATESADPWRGAQARRRER